MIPDSKLRELVELNGDAGCISCVLLASELLAARAEVERLRDLVSEFALCGTEHVASNYRTIQVDHDTWAEAQKVWSRRAGEPKP